MNVKKYLLIVLVTTMIFASACGAIAFYNFWVNPWADGSSSDDDGEESNPEEVRGLTAPVSGEARNILLVGVDKSELLTDVIMICRIDPVNKKVNIMSVPRDTKVKVKGKIMKINSAYTSGGKSDEARIEQTIETVKSVTGIPIHHYFRINTRAFRDTIDELGGVDFDVPQNMNYEDPLQDLYIHLKKGYQHLDGDKSEQLVRFRQYKMGDIDRIKVQQDFMAALIDQHLNITNVLKIPEIYGIIKSNSFTDMTGGELVTMGKEVLAIGGGNITSHILPGHTTDGSPYYICDYNDLSTMVNEYFK